MATTNATAPKSAPKKSQGFTGIKSGFAVIIVCFLIAECLYVFGAGHLSNFHAEGATGLPSSSSKNNLTNLLVSLSPSNALSLSALLTVKVISVSLLLL